MLHHVLLLASCLVMSLMSVSAMPYPWTRELTLQSPPLEGSDVLVAQNLLVRDSSSASLEISGLYDEATADAVRAFQSEHLLPVTGTLDSDSAQTLLKCCSEDGVVDDGFTAASMGYKYKMSIPVRANRSVETVGSLFDSENRLLLKFPVRAHGHRDDDGSYGWPDFGSQPPDVGLNSFTSSGNTVTGIIEVDLNSPEPNPQLYGPWPVNRLVGGLKGNAAWLLPNIRDGMLVHTGNWSTDGQTWDPTMSMPNSAGCLHTHPSSVEEIYRALVGIGVQVNENPFSGKDYPFKPQGVAVVYQENS